MAPLSLLPDLLSNIPLLAILLMITMSFPLLYMIDLRKGYNRKLVYKLFKAIPRVKKSYVK